MSVEIMEEVMAEYPAGGDELVLAIAIADCTTPEGDFYLSPGAIDWLAARCRLTRDATLDLLTKPVARGWMALCREDRRGDIGSLYSFRRPGASALPREQ